MMTLDLAFLPAGSTKPVNFLMANVAQQLIRAARATIHRFEELQLEN
jgi:hypothetical protein